MDNKWLARVLFDELSACESIKYQCDNCWLWLLQPIADGIESHRNWSVGIGDALDRIGDRIDSAYQEEFATQKQLEREGQLRLFNG